MLIFCWIFLFIEARDFNILGCVHKDPGWSYRAISDEEFVLPCAFPSQSHGQIFDNLYQHRSEVKWFWQSKGGGLLKSIGSESTNPILQGNALWFKPIRVNDSGLFICTIREEDSCLKINVEVQTKEMANCLNYGPNEQYLFIQTGDSILCPGKKCYRLLQRSQVTWYKNGKLVKDSRTSLKLEEDKITLHHVYAVDAGTYVCDYILFDDSRQWTMRTIVEVKTITKDTIHTPTILEPSGVKTFEVELGKPLELKCKVFFSFERNVSSLIMLYRENNKSKNKQLVQEPTRISSIGLEGDVFDHMATLREVTEADLSSNFTCFAQNSVGNATGVFRLKEKGKVLFIYILCGAIITLLGVLMGSAIVYLHRIEIVLVYRNYLAKDETVGDCKEFDAFVSHAKPDTFGGDNSFLDEEQFALEVLPNMLENNYGYKLCLLERDILPGGAYTDDIVKAIKKSRRAIIILSPSYISGPGLFELQAAVNCSLEDKTMKLILIKFQAFQEPDSLPPKVKKALRVLPMLTWKTSNSNKQLWKTMQYHMPVKNTRGLEKNCLNFFCFSWRSV